jgi:DNA-binding GntR family transcriptional regulator
LKKEPSVLVANPSMKVREAMSSPSEVIPIERPTLHMIVVSRIRDMVIEGTLPAGARIHEGQVGEQLGISRTPLREALKVLASEGLVELVPSRGAVVTTLTPKAAQDMLDVLKELEAMAAPLICENASDEEIAEICQLHDKMLGFYATRSRLEYFKLNQQIHSRLISLAGNESLSLVYEILQTRMKRIRFIGDKKEDSWQAAVEDHDKIIEALKSRNGPRLSAAMVEHVTSSWERIKCAL